MASRHEAEVTITSAKDLKNVNWRHGPNRPYAVLWVDPNKKCSTRVDEEGDTCPHWDETLVIPLPGRADDETTLFIDVVHAGDEEDTKKLIGSAKLRLIEVIDDFGLGERASRTLKLKRPSGRPQGKLDVKVAVREQRYPPPGPYSAPPYGVPPPSGYGDYPAPPPPPPSGSRDYTAPPPPYGYQYGQPPQPGRDPYYATAAPSRGYPYGGYNAPAAYVQPSYGAYGAPPPVGQVVDGEKKNKFGGMGTGLAVGAVGGALGGLALAEGFDALEDKIADDAADKVEDDLGYDVDDF